MRLHHFHTEATGATVAAIVIVYLTLATGHIRTLRPWCDEGWFSSPALNLLTTGRMGTSVLDPTATFRSVQLTGINEATYWILPLYILAQAAWYKLIGFSLPAMRALSTVWGLVALLSWYVIVRCLSGEKRVALIAIALLAIDFEFLTGASSGRMDMMAAALGFAGMAAYLVLRTVSLTWAVVTSHTLVAASVLTHPLGVIPFVGLLFLTGYYNAPLLRWRHLVIAPIPYLLGFGGWSLYILERPAIFLAQFGGNASDRWTAFRSPLQALNLEITGRYLTAYGFAPETEGIAHLKVVVYLIYMMGVIACVCIPDLRRHCGYRALLVLTAIYFCMLPILDGFQQLFYLVHIVPLFAAAVAASIHWGLKQHRAAPALAMIVICLVATQLSVSGYRFFQNPYGASYLPAGQFLKANMARDTLVMGSAEWAFELGFGGHLVDDFRLGFRSGKKADLIVIDDRRYAEWIGHLALDDPPNYRYIQQMLKEQFRLVYDQPFYKIFARSETASGRQDRTPIVGSASPRTVP